jgi:hypothetical protein
MRPRQGARFLRVRVAPADDPAGSSRLHLAWGQTAGNEAILDAHSPELEEEEPEPGTQGSIEW